MKNKGIVFYINSLKFFISHRKNLARLAYLNNYKVIICCKIDTNFTDNEFKNYKIIDINFRGSELNLINETKNIIKIKKIININKNYIHHFITIKPIFYASVLRNILIDKKIVISFSGLGFIVSNTSFRAKLLKIIFIFFSAKLFKNNNLKIIFQNLDDYYLIKTYTKFKKTKSIIIPGSGIDLMKVKYTPMPNNNKITFLLVSRLLKDKGIYEFIEASNNILKNTDKVNFIIIGDLDKNNPSFINKSILDSWIDNKNKFFKKYQQNIIEHIQNADVVVLPSYREGMPKILIEANAVGRPIITTNVPGCKECVIDGLNGFLCEAKNVYGLTQSIKKIISQRKNLNNMSKQSRLIAENKFSIKFVNEKHFKVYEE